MKIHIKNPLVLRTVPEGFVLENADIYVDGARILSIGREPDGFFADHIIDAQNKLAMPGLINMHTHNYMSMFRNIANDTSFGEWLFGNMEPREELLEPSDCYWGSLLSIMEMLRTGTTCFNDMFFRYDTSIKAAADAGIRAFVGRGLAGDINDDAGQRGLAEALDQADRWKGNPLITYVLCPHAPYSCTGYFYQQIADEAERRGMLMHTHLSESTTEVENFKKEHGNTPIEYLDMLGVFRVPTIIAHCCKLEGRDMEILSNPLLSVVTNPASNMKLGNGFAPVPEMLDAGVRVTLGTDGPASNNALNLFREMGMLGLIHKGRKGDPLPVSAVKALQMVTTDAAQALGLGSELGRLEEGYQADIVLINLKQPQFMPWNDIISSLVYSSYGSEVETVIIRGELIMENRRFTNIDEEAVYAEVSRRARRINTDFLKA